MTTTESDRRVADLVRVLGGSLIVNDAAILAEVPNATALELYTALTALQDVIAERMRQLAPAARAERVAQLGGIN